MQNFWPFLYAANPDLDYRTVVAPDFLVRAKQVSLLRRNLSTAVNESAEGEIKSSKVEAKGIGPVTFFYRPVFVTESGKEVYDYHGRPIVRVSGVAIRDRKDKGDFKDGEIETLIERADASLEGDFRAFWSTANGRRAVPSSPMRHGDGQTPTEEPTEPEAEAPEGKRPAATEWAYFLAGGLTAATAGILVLLAYLWFQVPEQGKVQQLQNEVKDLKALVVELRKKAK